MAAGKSTKKSKRSKRSKKTKGANAIDQAQGETNLDSSEGEDIVTPDESIDEDTIEVVEAPTSPVPDLASLGLDQAAAHILDSTLIELLTSPARRSEVVFYTHQILMDYTGIHGQVNYDAKPEMYFGQVDLSTISSAQAEYIRTYKGAASVFAQLCTRIRTWFVLHSDAFSRAEKGQINALEGIEVAVIQQEFHEARCILEKAVKDYHLADVTTKAKSRHEKLCNKVSATEKPLQQTTASFSPFLVSPDVGNPKIIQILLQFFAIYSRGDQQEEAANSLEAELRSVDLGNLAPAQQIQVTGFLAAKEGRRRVVGEIQGWVNADAGLWGQEGRMMNFKPRVEELGTMLRVYNQMMEVQIIINTEVQRRQASKEAERRGEV